MVSSGIRDVEDTSDKVNKVILDNEEQLVASYKIFDEATSISGLSGGGTPATGQGSFTGNAMDIDGDNWTGRYGHLEEVVTIVNGLINISRNADNDDLNSASSSMIILNPEGGVGDFLDRMVPGSDVLRYPIQYIQTKIQNIILRIPLLLIITNIVGNGVDNIITVTVPSTSALATNDSVQISNTTNFNISSAAITVTGGTTFTYDLGIIGSAISESSGDVDRGNLSLPDNISYVCQANTFLCFIFDTILQKWALVYASNTNIPVLTTTLPANKAAADDVFGSRSGTIGIYDNGSTILRAFIRQNDGNWGSVNLTRDQIT